MPSAKRYDVRRVVITALFGGYCQKRTLIDTRLTLYLFARAHRIDAANRLKRKNFFVVYVDTMYLSMYVLV